MADLSTVLTVLGLFMLRIGVPVLVLVGLGILIERWQGKQRGKARHDQDPTDGVRVEKDIQGDDTVQLS